MNKSAIFRVVNKEKHPMDFLKVTYSLYFSMTFLPSNCGSQLRKDGYIRWLEI